MIPIYQDTYYVTTAATLDFNIIFSGATIFSGRSVRFPDAENLKINVSRICENYLTEDIPETVWENSAGSWNDTNAAGAFHIENSSGTPLAFYTFYNDWSYDDDFDRSEVETSLAFPINRRYAPNMYGFESKYDDDGELISTFYNRGVGSTYDTPGCGDYAIYYLNRYGGWDSFLFEGKVTRTDNYDIKSYTRREDALSMRHSEDRYVNNITTNWKCNTSWLTDEQAANLSFNLLPSNKVYFHDLVNDIVCPAVIVDTAATYKTFKNQGRKRVSYEIQIKASAKQTVK